jgi:hypothetical protein
LGTWGLGIGDWAQLIIILEIIFVLLSNNCNRLNVTSNSELNKLNLLKNENTKTNFLINPNNIESINKFVFQSEFRRDSNNMINVKPENKKEIVNKKVETNLQLNSTKQPIKIFYFDYFKAKYCCYRNKNKVVNKHIRIIKDYQSYFSRCLDILTYFST